MLLARQTREVNLLKTDAGLFGNDRPRSPRPDEGRRNHLPSRAAANEAEVTVANVAFAALLPTGVAPIARVEIASVMATEVQEISAEELKGRVGELRRFL